MKHWLKILFKQAKEGRFKIFLICFAFVFSIASLNKMSKYYTNNLRITLNITDLPTDKVLVNESEVQIDLTLTTYGFNWLRYAVIHPKMSLSAQDLDVTQTSYVWMPNKHANLIRSQLDKDVDWDMAASEPLDIPFDQYDQKKVPIILNAKLSFAPGYDSYESPVLQPDSVIIVGPSGSLKAIKSVITVPFEKEQIKANLDQLVALSKLDDPRLRLTFSETRVIAKVDKFSEGTIEVPIIINSTLTNAQIRHFPKSTQVRFYTSLDRFPLIKSDDFIITCTLDSSSVDMGYLKPELIKWPSYVRNVKIGVNRVEFILIE